MTNTEYSLYRTDQNSMMRRFGHDCLYEDDYFRVSDWTVNYLLDGLTAFCIRSERLNSEEELCTGTLISFKELKRNQVRISDLFDWNVVIETIDLYEKYLVFPNLVDENEVFCKCSTPTQFGKSCQYDNQVSLRYQNLNERLSEETEIENPPWICYIGLQCQTNNYCLDWRQICNGIVDCDHGEDEIADLCFEMETNECHPEKEFRCQNGLCIPIGMISRFGGVCSDLSDRREVKPPVHEEPKCLYHTVVEYNNINTAWKQFSCFNGYSISYSSLTSEKGCTNDYHHVYLRSIFPKNDTNPCWISLMCLTGMNDLYSHLDCSEQITIDQSCPNQFYFPSNSVIYSFVYFLYDQTNRRDWSEYSGPNFICYRKDFCPNHTFNVSTFSKDDLTCFLLNPEHFSWKYFLEYILHLFSPCFASSTPSNHPMLFHCHQSQSWISMHRLKDKRQDCFFNEDESESIDLCSFSNKHFFKCASNQSECIQPFFVGDNRDDCADGSDEYLKDERSQCVDMICGSRLLVTRTLAEIFRFKELCDNFVNRRFFPLGSKETDETDCEHWPYSCNSPYSRCNQIWNCADGRDEMDCIFTYESRIQQALGCQSEEHYCIKLLNDGLVNSTCLNRSREGDGTIDCIGATDEQFTRVCAKKYPQELFRRFQCMNSSLCIRIDQLCDRIVDCPLRDDEIVCLWGPEMNSPFSDCQKPSTASFAKCDADPFSPECTTKETLWFCYLSTENVEPLILFRYVFEIYPPIDQNNTPMPFPTADINPLFAPEQRALPRVSPDCRSSLCNLGRLIKFSADQTVCLCPPTHYGDHCEYQAERVTVALRCQLRYEMSPLTVFRLVISLLNENDLVVSYEQFAFHYRNGGGVFDSGRTMLIYLMSERMTNMSLRQQSKSKSVRIDSYIVKENEIRYVSSWLFPVAFPFLPVNRLAADIQLVNESFRVIYCQKPCGPHGKCFHYINAKDKEYCWCEQGWFGANCQLKSSACHSTACSPHSQCLTLNEEKQEIECLCPLGKSGQQCYITHNDCSTNHCENNATCLPLNGNFLYFACACRENYYGPTCDSYYPWSYISVDGNIRGLSTIPFAVAIVGGIEGDRLVILYQFLYKGLVLPNSLRIPSIPCLIGFVQIFPNSSTSFYYMIYLRIESDDHSLPNTSLRSENFCPNVSDIFNDTILNEYSYLKRLKLYQLPCHENHQLRCFFDEYRMCFCTRDHRSDCFFYDHQYGHCDYCQNNGRCLQQDFRVNSWNFVCLCQKCSYGSFCQFVSGAYMLTFDMLIGIDMNTEETSFRRQSTVIHFSLAFLLLMLIVSLVCNTISFAVFFNKKLREVGCDFYLLMLTIISQMGIICLFLRFLYMIIVQMYIIENLLFLQITCISLEYLIRLFPSLFDWLTVCISIERAFTVVKNVHFTKVSAVKTLRLSHWITLLVVVLNILSTFHRLFYLRIFDEPTINDEPRGHPWCVLDLGSTQWNVYEKFITGFHLIIPFVLNFFSVIGFTIFRTNIEFKSAAKGNKNNKIILLKGQFSKYKSVIISPAVILILGIPRFVLIFALVCIEQTWQRYVYFFGYIISFLPLISILFIYILPSPKYRKEFQRLINKTLHLSAHQQR